MGFSKEKWDTDLHTVTDSVEFSNFSHNNLNMSFINKVVSALYEDESLLQDVLENDLKVMSLSMIQIALKILTMSSLLCSPPSHLLK